MSTTALRFAFKSLQQVSMSVPARLVLLALANRHNQETGRCDPSIKRLCEDTQLSERSVRYGIRELEDLKLVATTERKLRTGRGKRNMTNRYKLRGGAQYAGGMGHNMPPKLEDTPSAYDDLAMILEDVRETGPLEAEPNTPRRAG